MKKLLAACEELKDIYENPIRYDEYQHEFLLNNAIEDVIETYEKEVKQKEMMERFIG